MERSHSQERAPVTDASQSAPIFVGIDVAKNKLDLACSGSDAVRTFVNDAQGIGQVIQLLLELRPTLVVVEATGGLERALVDALLVDALPAALVNPGQVRYFARGLGILAKTDAIDARVLREYARLASPRLTQKRSQNQAELESLVTCRRQLLQVKTEQTNRRSTATSKSAIGAIDAVLKTVTRQVLELDRKIAKLIESDDEMNHLDKLLTSVPGVGAILSATLLSELAEIGELGRRELCALAGVAPMNCDSGKFKGKRAIRGGRTSVRCVLYMASIAAIRFNPVIKQFADRLKKAGKLNKVIIVACMRKLLSILNAMIREDLSWNQLNLVKNA